MPHVNSEFAHELAKEEMKTTQQNAMQLNLKLLRISGIAMPPNAKANISRKILSQVQVVLCAAWYSPVVLGQVLALYRFWGDLDICTNNLFTLLGGTMSFAEGIYARINAREIEELFETFQNKVVTKMTAVGFKDKKREVYDSACKKARLLTIMMVVSLEFMAVSWIPVPFIRHLMEGNNNVTNTEIDEKKKWVNFCYIIWYPTDITASPYFEIVYACQATSYLIGITYMMAVDMTGGAMMVHIAAQFEMLCIDFRNIDMILSAAEEKKKESRILQQRAVDVCIGDYDELLPTDTGSRVERDPQECDTARVRGHGYDTEMKNEDLSEPKRYLAHFIQYHQAVVQ
jgi:hypothetical protein